jgi:hypothetical protein
VPGQSRISFEKGASLARKTSKPKTHTQIENVSIFGATARMAPLGLIVYAESFLSAARLITVSSEMEFIPARTYLACHALELALKPFLSLKGHSLAKLAEGAFSHNLGTILTQAEQHGLSDIVGLTELQQFHIRRASKYYAEKVFEYPAIGEALRAYSDRPDDGALIAAAEVLVAALRDPCLHAQ